MAARPWQVSEWWTSWWHCSSPGSSSTRSAGDASWRPTRSRCRFYCSPWRSSSAWCQGAWSEPVAVDVANTLRRLLPLILLPFAAVNLLETREDVDRGLQLLLALVAYKAITGAVGWSLGSGRELDGTVLTYYGSAANLLLMGFLLVLVAALGSRTSLPAAAWWLAPLALAVLVLSFRRNFWIATVLGVVLVLLVATGRRGRALLIPGGGAASPSRSTSGPPRSPVRRARVPSSSARSRSLRRSSRRAARTATGSTSSAT